MSIVFHKNTAFWKTKRPFLWAYAPRGTLVPPPRPFVSRGAGLRRDGPPFANGSIRCIVFIPQNTVSIVYLYRLIFRSVYKIFAIIACSGQPLKAAKLFCERRRTHKLRYCYFLYYTRAAPLSCQPQ
jgi:hypothetical protein